MFNSVRINKLLLQPRAFLLRSLPKTLLYASCLPKTMLPTAYAKTMSSTLRERLLLIAIIRGSDNLLSLLRND